MRDDKIWQRAGFYQLRGCLLAMCLQSLPEWETDEEDVLRCQRKLQIECEMRMWELESRKRQRSICLLKGWQWDTFTTWNGSFQMGHTRTRRPRGMTGTPGRKGRRVHAWKIGEMASDMSSLPVTRRYLYENEGV
jgi:hypothetical protein